MIAPLTILILLMSPVHPVDSNKKTSVSRQSKAKRTIKSRRGNIKKARRRSYNRKHTLTRRKKAGGTITDRRNSRATNKTTNKENNTGTHQHSQVRQPNKDTTKEKSKSVPAPVLRKRSQYRTMMEQWATEIILSDPELQPPASNTKK